MEAGTAVREYWARVWAKAIKEAKENNSSFKTKLETDPFLANRQFRQELGLPPDLGPLIDDLFVYEADTGVAFSAMTVAQLEAIIAGNPIKAIQPNELKP